MKKRKACKDRRGWLGRQDRWSGLVTYSRMVKNALRPHLAYAWRNVPDQERLRAMVGAAQDAVSLGGWGDRTKGPTRGADLGGIGYAVPLFPPPVSHVAAPAPRGAVVGSPAPSSLTRSGLELGRPLSPAGRDNNEIAVCESW